MYSVVLNGFKTKPQAEEFVDWYEGQGEQDIEYWLEEHDMNVSMSVDVHTPYEWVDNALHVKLKVE